MNLEEKFNLMKNDFITILQNGFETKNGCFIIEEKKYLSILNKYKVLDFREDDNIILHTWFFFYAKSGSDTGSLKSTCSNLTLKNARQLKQLLKLNPSTVVLNYPSHSKPVSDLKLKRRSQNLTAINKINSKIINRVKTVKAVKK
ncbi:MAG: hypothetical protein Q8L90_07060 [Bacteroidota bacterium]|nr:hypothetical protein [Bacteroidota bacterium]